MFVCLYNAALWSMFTCAALFQNTWIEMRVNLGWVFFALILVLFALQMAIRPLRRLCGTYTGATFSLIMASVGCWLLLGTERLAIIPASIIREGLMMPRLPFKGLNFVMDAFLTLGWLWIACRSRREAKKNP